MGRGFCRVGCLSRISDRVRSFKARLIQDWGYGVSPSLPSAFQSWDDWLCRLILGTVAKLLHCARLNSFQCCLSRLGLAGTTSIPVFKSAPCSVAAHERDTPSHICYSPRVRTLRVVTAAEAVVVVVVGGGGGNGGGRGGSGSARLNESSSSL